MDHNYNDISNMKSNEIKIILTNNNDHFERIS
ncbi:MAG: hypothetical protein HeimC3_46520 [Candidatus Heimdallarchaeota archaeon LC_3]|nr:MAG: hypothetical protein HeimC3_46520 [Candidatus Heimdallarchaeota archaeon LC_3]